jgi:hypothetical protein
VFIKIALKEVIPKEETLTNRVLSASQVPACKNEIEKECSHPFVWLFT